MNKYISYGKVENGKIIPFNKEEFLQWVKSREGEEIEVTCKVTKNSKTFRQLRLVYRMYGVIADTTGYTVKETHLILKDEFLEPHVYEIGDRVITECATLADISKKDMSNYINQVADWAAQNLNLHLLSPDERLFLDSLR